MSPRSKPRTLILATSFAPERRPPTLRPQEYPRTEYVELTKILDCEILDYEMYADSLLRLALHRLESKARLDIHLAITGYRKARDFDAVLLMSERVAIPYMMLQKMLGRRCASVYVSAHSSKKQARLVRATRLFDTLDIVVGNYAAQQQFFVKEMCIPAHKFRFVRYAVDEDFYTPGPGGEYVFSCGSAQRDYAVLFRAVEKLPVSVKVAIGGRSYGLGIRHRLPKIPANVELVARTDAVGMRSLHQNAALVAVPLKGPAGSTAVLEAMCCGRAVVAGRVESMSDYVEDGVTGLLPEPFNENAMKEAIASLMSYPERREQMGARARAAMEEGVTLSRLVTGLAESVRDACESGLTVPG